MTGAEKIPWWRFIKRHRARQSLRIAETFVDEFMRKFPGRCPVCALYQHWGRPAEDHNCPEKESADV